MPDKTGYLILELGTQCNLGQLHDKCPNQHPDRYKHVDTSRAMSDDTIVDTAVAMIQKHGFRGLIGWHFYNETTLSLDRMFRLMSRIQVLESSARFVLWTNGTLIQQDCSEYEQFAEIHVTDYGLDSIPCLSNRLHGMKGAVHVHRWPLDDRLTATGNEPGRPESDEPCCRMFTELIFDYYGNVHLCCYDWRGLGSPGNIHYNTVESIVKRWQATRRAMIGVRMENREFSSVAPLLDASSHREAMRVGQVTLGTVPAVPQVCRSCTAPGRNAHITSFVKAPAQAALAYRLEILNREK